MQQKLTDGQVRAAELLQIKEGKATYVVCTEKGWGNDGLHVGRLYYLEALNSGFGEVVVREVSQGGLYRDAIKASVLQFNVLPKDKEDDVVKLHVGNDVSYNGVIGIELPRFVYFYNEWESLTEISREQRKKWGLPYNEITVTSSHEIL